MFYGSGSMSLASYAPMHACLCVFHLYCLQCSSLFCEHDVSTIDPNKLVSPPDSVGVVLVQSIRDL